MAEDTKEQILRAAEVLFAREGFANTSMREITDAADVNIAAVNYHFGSKERLLIEILDRIVAPLNEERIRILDEMETVGTPNTVDLLTAFLLPDLRLIQELRSRDPSLPRFVSRMYSEASDLMTRTMGRQFAETQKRFYSAFANALPDVRSEEIAWRLNCVVGIVVYLFASVQAPGSPPMLAGKPESDLDRLLTVTVPLMTAPGEGVAVSRK